MKLNSTPKPMAKVASSRAVAQMAHHVAQRVRQDRRKRTNCRSRGSVSATTIAAATSVISATTSKAARQPIASVTDARNEAAANPPMLVPDHVKAGDARDVGRRPLVADIGDGDGEDRRHAADPGRSARTTSSGTLAAKVMITVGTTMANIAAVISRLRPTTSASAPVNGAVSAIATVPAVISALISPAPT